jgi:hypothetical protein
MAARISDARMPPERWGVLTAWSAALAASLYPAPARTVSDDDGSGGSELISVSSSSTIGTLGRAGERTIGTGATGVGWRGDSGGRAALLPRAAGESPATRLGSARGTIGGAGSGLVAVGAGGTSPSGWVSSGVRTTGKPIEVGLCFPDADPESGARGEALCRAERDAPGVDSDGGSCGDAARGALGSLRATTGTPSPGVAAVKGTGRPSSVPSPCGRGGSSPIVVGSSSTTGSVALIGLLDGPAGGFGGAAGSLSIAGKPIDVSLEDGT